MQLYYFLAIIISLSFGSLPGSEQSFAHAAGFSTSVIIGWWILCHLASRLITTSIESGELSPDTGFRLFDTQMECFRWFSLVLIMLCLGGFGLGRNFDSIPLLQDSLTLQSILLLTPALMIMLGIWLAEYRFARQFEWVKPGFLSMAGNLAAALRSNVGWLLIPMLMVMFVIDLTQHVPLPDLLPGWTVWLALAILAIISLPTLVRKIFPTTPMDPEVEAWIHDVVSAAGVRPLKVAQWDTKYRVHNAMVAGLLGRFRVILVSDRLVDELTREELAMVILHELAHVKRFHVPLRVVSLIPAWFLGAVVERIASSQQTNVWASDWAPALGALASLLATVLVLRWVSYRSEFDADAVACELAVAMAGTCPSVPESMDQAALDLSSALLKVTDGCEAARRPTWLHPGICDRIARLRQRSSTASCETSRVSEFALTTRLH